ncbi:MAG: RidA family protein [Acidimicrobiia bacterium]|nr:RidA family protein [Acidimicrobiia bacterium]
MTHEAVSSPDAPAAIGPYSPAVRTSHLLFLSGQIPLDPADGSLVEGGITAQTRQVMQNLGALLATAGLSFAHVVKTTVYLRDLSEFAEMNAVYATFVGDPPPARSTVEVARLPRDVRVEIDAIAVVEEVRSAPPVPRQARR